MLEQPPYRLQLFSTLVFNMFSYSMHNNASNYHIERRSYYCIIIYSELMNFLYWQ